MLISHYICIYKIIAKFNSIRVKILLSKSLSSEKIIFLEGRQNHEAIRVSQKIIHSTKTKSLKAMVLKFVLSKAYRSINQLYITFILIHLVFFVHFVNRVINCLTSMFFSMLNFDYAYPLFRHDRALRKGQSPILLNLGKDSLPFC